MPTTKVTRDVFDGSIRPIQSIDIDGGSVDNTPIGSTTPEVGFFTNLQTSNLIVTNSVDFTGASLTGITAFYADLAERYESDHIYEPGTVVSLGGTKEITETGYHNHDDMFGVISSEPAMVLNSKPDDNDHMLPVALVGRVPCRVLGPVEKGQRLTPCGQGCVRASVHDDDIILGRSLVDDFADGIRLVEIAINTIK